MCVHVFICVDKTLRFNENPCEGLGHLLINILIRHRLAEQKMLVLFWCLVLWILLPSSCVWVPQLQTDRRELSKHTCQLLPLSVLVRQDCQKGRALFLKAFQNFGMLSFEKSVEEMILWPTVFSFGNLDLLNDFP